jgi:hypothetical protein
MADGLAEPTHATIAGMDVTVVDWLPSDDVLCMTNRGGIFSLRQQRWIRPEGSGFAFNGRGELVSTESVVPSVRSDRNRE